MYLREVKFTSSFMNKDQLGAQIYENPNHITGTTAVRVGRGSFAIHTGHLAL
jgi:hypothetical protein